MPRLQDGTFGASQVEAGRLLQEYVEMAEQRKWELLLGHIDVNTDGPKATNAHPNAVLFAAVQILVAVAKQTGARSAVPFIQSYLAALQNAKDTTTDLWTPGN